MLDAQGQRASGIEQVMAETDGDAPAEPDEPTQRPLQARLRSPLQFVKHWLYSGLADRGEFATDSSAVPKRFMTDPTCPVCRTAEIISGKWTLLVIRDLADDSRRFCELERSLEGISPRTLSLRLRALEEHGIVERHTYPEVPPRVEYALTEKGRRWCR